MTTNVFDMGQRRLASDSRWSVVRNFAILYVDDTGFDKIEIAHGHAFIFAGNGRSIQRWKEWIRTAPIDESGEPAVDGMALCIVSLAAGSILFEWGQDIRLDDARFAGSGAFFAHGCWTVNGCARRAVESAKVVDPLSGGEVKFFELNSGENNLRNTASILDVEQAIVTRGYIMYTNSPAPKEIPVLEAAANDARVEELCKGIANGDIHASAPCDSMYNDWTAEDKTRLRAALGQVFGWAK
jgi:hypothetical protein